MSANTIAGYGLGAFYPPNLGNNAASVVSAGWTTVMVSLFHPNQKGDIHFNNTPVFVSGDYVGDSDWVSQLQQLEGITLLASFGGGGVGDFTNIQNIYEANDNSFDGTNLEANFKAFAATFKDVIWAIDMDVEDNYDLPSFVAFCNLVVSLGFKVSFCPYTYQDFWTSALQQVNDANANSVAQFNLQCYSGGTGNDPADWAKAITDSIPGFDTTNFIVASTSADQSPSQVQQALKAYAGEDSVDGAFLWNLDTILNGGDGTQAEYVTAIKDALG